MFRESLLCATGILSKPAARRGGGGFCREIKVRAQENFSSSSKSREFLRHTRTRDGGTEEGDKGWNIELKVRSKPPPCDILYFFLPAAKQTGQGTEIVVLLVVVGVTTFISLP